MIKRHKVFVSYYHKEDQDYKKDLGKMKYFNPEKQVIESVFIDYSVGDDDIDDTNMSDEQIRIKIRDEYIKDATVLILLCGKNTRKRKHVDWEINAAMFHTEKNPKMGILVINLPNITQAVRAHGNEEKKLVSDGGNWERFETRRIFEENYPYMPERIIDNFVQGVPIAVVEWDRISKNPDRLMSLIDNAFNRRQDLNYDHSRPLRKHNS